MAAIQLTPPSSAAFLLIDGRRERVAELWKLDRPTPGSSMPRGNAPHCRSGVRRQEMQAGDAKQQQQQQASDAQSFALLSKQ